MTSKQKSGVGLLVALVVPFVLLAAGVHGWALIVSGIGIVIAVRLLMDLWPDRDDRP